MEKEEVLNDFKFVSRCLKIIKINNIVTKRDICEKTKDTQENVNFIKLLKFLIIEGFIEVDKSRIPYTYKINNKLLSKFLRESIFFRDFGIVVEKTVIGYNY